MNEDQKQLAIQMLDICIEHAEGHRKNHELNAPVYDAWDHEVRFLTGLRDSLAPSKEFENELVSALRAIFGEGVRIISTEELFNSPEFNAPQEGATEDVMTSDEQHHRWDAKAPQMNKFDHFTPTHKHIRSGGLYMKLGDASEEATMNHVVMYANKAGETFTRPASEFYDYTRFEELPR